MRLIKIFIMVCVLLPGSVFADEVMVAVANNFYRPMQAIAKDFKAVTGNKVVLSTGSTGQLYAQIVNGAPFDVFLAADTKCPTKLVEAGLASDEFTYAQGRLVLWSPKEWSPKEWSPKAGSSKAGSSKIESSKKGEEVLLQPEVKHIALANPKLAPYGLAAQQAMEKIGIYSKLKAKFVLGKGLNPTYQFVVTGNADVGFLAMSQIYKDGKFIEGFHWEVPKELYSPIKQDAVVLKNGMGNSAAMTFIKYLASDRAKKLITKFGYL